MIHTQKNLIHLDQKLQSKIFYIWIDWQFTSFFGWFVRTKFLYNFYVIFSVIWFEQFVTCVLLWCSYHFFFKEKTYMSRINLSILKSNDMCCHTGRSRFNLRTVKYRSRQESNMMLLYWCSHVNPNFFCMWILYGTVALKKRKKSETKDFDIDLNIGWSFMYAKCIKSSHSSCIYNT